jgi:DNA-binding transcriptional ArsR family regulator
VVDKLVFKIQAELCKCMSSAKRIEIVHTLREGPLQVGEIARRTGFSNGLVSRHLGVLRQGGVVSGKRKGQAVIYQIANPKIVRICDLMREVLSEEASYRSRLAEALHDEQS